MIFLLCVMKAAYPCPDVLLVSNNSHFAMVHRIEASLFSQPSPRPVITHLLVDHLQSGPGFAPDPKIGLVVTFGAEALEAVLRANINIPILSILIRKNTFYELLKQYDRAESIEQRTVSAIFLDHPLERQLNLIQVLFTDLKSKGAVGVLLGPGSIYQQDELLNQAHRQGLKLNTIYVNSFENPVAVMDAFLDEVKVLLALPDNRIFNPHTARGVLLAAFHKHVPLIGYSQSYVKNGALISMFSNTKQIADQTAQFILTTLNNNQMPLPQEPIDFCVEINYQVARSLNIAMESESAIHHKLSALEMHHSVLNDVSDSNQIKTKANQRI